VLHELRKKLRCFESTGQCKLTASFDLHKLTSSYIDLRANLTYPFRVGLEKLEHTEIEVKDMQEILIRMKPELDAAAEATAIMIEEINQDTVSIT